MVCQLLEGEKHQAVHHVQSHFLVTSYCLLLLVNYYIVLSIGFFMSLDVLV
jgi:hypothetical protein